MLIYFEANFGNGLHVDKIRSETGQACATVPCAPKCPYAGMLALPRKGTAEMEPPFEMNLCKDYRNSTSSLVQLESLRQTDAFKYFSLSRKVRRVCQPTARAAPFNPFREPISPSCTFLFNRYLGSSFSPPSLLSLLSLSLSLSLSPFGQEKPALTHQQRRKMG